MKSRIILLALFLVSITGKIGWRGEGGRVLILYIPRPGWASALFRGYIAHNYARVSHDDSKEVTTLGQCCVNGESATSSPVARFPFPRCREAATRVSEGSARGWRVETRGETQRERNGALKVTIYFCGASSRAWNDISVGETIEILVYRRRPVEWRRTFER